VAAPYLDFFQLGQLVLIVGVIVLIWPWRHASRLVVTRTLQASRPAAWAALIDIGEITDSTSPRHPLVPNELVSRKKISENPEIWESVFDKSGGRRAALWVVRSKVLKREEPLRFVSRAEELNGQTLPLGADSYFDYQFEEASAGTRVTLTCQMVTRTLWHYINLRRFYGKLLDKPARFFANGDVASTMDSRRKLLISIAISLVAVASFVLCFGWIGSVLLTAIVLMHEFGHWLAMRLTGEPAPRIMLVPFFGGATIADNEHKSLFDEAFCALMGPALSALLCLALLAVWYCLGAPQFYYGTVVFPRPGPNQQWAIVALLTALAVGVINLIQLVPIPPFDGGVLLRTFLQSLQGRLARPVLLIATLGACAAALWIAVAVWMGAIVLVPFAAMGALEVYHMGWGEPARRPMSVRGLAAIAAGAALTVAVHATPLLLLWDSTMLFVGSDHGRRCADAEAASDLQIAGCTALIESGRGTPEALATAYYNRGEAYRRRGEQGAAIDDCDQAIRLKPDFAPGFACRGNAYSDQRDFDRAIADLDEAIRLEGENAVYRGDRGMAFHHKGDFDRAIADYGEAIRLDTDEPMYLWNRALVYRRTGELDRAAADYRAALALAPDEETKGEIDAELKRLSATR
jgi:Zn-dependent protease